MAQNQIISDFLVKNSHNRAPARYALPCIKPYIQHLTRVIAECKKTFFSFLVYISSKNDFNDRMSFLTDNDMSAWTHFGNSTGIFQRRSINIFIHAEFSAPPGFPID